MFYLSSCWDQCLLLLPAPGYETDLAWVDVFARLVENLASQDGFLMKFELDDNEDRKESANLILASVLIKNDILTSK